MINLKKFFQPNPCLLPVSKPEKELLEYFIANKTEFENWFLHRPQARMRFQFYYPTAVDFFFDNFHLFTAYYKRPALGSLQLQELKMTQENYTTIRSASWKPFEEVMLQFLQYLEEKNKIQFYQRTSSLHEYMAICDKTAPVNGQPLGINPSMATG